MTPIAASKPLITLDGKNAAMKPARIAPNAICNAPAMTTATRKVWNEPSVAICVKTIAVKPAAGPETLVCEPLRRATTRPPMTPLRIPDIIGAFEAKAIPRQRGRATKKTTSPAEKSLESVFEDKVTFSYLMVDDKKRLVRIATTTIGP